MKERETRFIIKELPYNIFGAEPELWVCWKVESKFKSFEGLQVQDRVIQLYEKNDKTYIIVERTITREI